MANRIRSMKPEILEDEKTAFLSHLEYRLFTGSWIIADDYGNMRGDPDYLRCQIIWASKETRDSVSGALQELVQVGLLQHYTVRGQTYYHIVNFGKHQRIEKPGKPKCPGPDQSDDSESDADNRSSNDSGNDSANDSRFGQESFPPDQGSGIRDQGVGKGVGVGGAANDSPEPTPKPPKRRRHRIPADWQPNDPAKLYAREHRLDLNAASGKFKRHYASTGAPRLDWDEAFAGWLENDADRSSRNGARASPAQTVLEVLKSQIAEAEERDHDQH